MKKIYQVVVSVFIIVITSGCGARNMDMENVGVDSVESTVAPTESPVVSSKNNEGTEEEINEEIMDHFFVEATIRAPRRTYSSYQTSLKRFEVETMISMLLPDVQSGEIQAEEFGGPEDGMAITYKDTEIRSGLGYLDFSKDADIRYIRQLFSYAGMHNKLENQELGFLSMEEADVEAREILSNLGIGIDLYAPKIFSFDRGRLTSTQDYLINNDADFNYFSQIGKIATKDIFQEDDETYLVEYAFMLDDIPVFDTSNPSIPITGGIDAPAVAYPMKAMVYISSSGIRSIELVSVLESSMEVSKEQKIIEWPGIREGLKKKYGDIILTQELKINDIRLVYVPLMDISTYGSITITPVWCCEFEMENIDPEDESPPPRYADWFNAFTGEVIS